MFMDILYWIFAIIGIIGAFWWIWNKVVREKNRLLKTRYVRENPELRRQIEKQTVVFNIFFSMALLLTGLIILIVYLILKYVAESHTATNNMLYISILILIIGIFGTIMQTIKLRKEREE
jgi:nicotinamide riboside transporter PnuC